MPYTPNTNLNKYSDFKNHNDKKTDSDLLNYEVSFPLWLSVSESAKIGGVTSKTIRRAIQANKIKFKIIKNRYLINFISVINFFSSNTKLNNKLNQHGIGQYIEKWKK